MINGLLEFSFAGIPQEHLAPMLLDLVCDENNVTSTIFHGNDISRSSAIDTAFWNSLVSLGEDVFCYVNLRTLKIQGTSVAHASLLFIRYKNTNDLSVLLSTTDCRRASILASDEFYQWARTIAEKYGCKNFCGGLDSACDKDTQMYTKSGVSTITTL